MTKSIMILAIAAAFVVGTIVTGTMAFAGDDDELTADLSGSQEVPSVDTDTTGEASFEVDGDKIEFELEVEDGVLITRAHIHCAPVGSNGPIVVGLLENQPSDVRLSGDVELEATITDDSISNDACGETIEELVESMRAGETYVNVHSFANPPGEIRGQIVSDDDD